MVKKVLTKQAVKAPNANPYVDLQSTGIGNDIYQQANVKPATTLGEKTKAAFDMSMEESTTNALLNYKSLNELKMQKDRISAEELNEMYPDTEKPFLNAMSAAAAKEINDRSTKVKMLQERVMNGPDEFYANALTFGAGMIPHMFDPLNIAADFAIGGPIGTFLRGWKHAPKLLKGAGFGSRVARGMIADTAANLITEPAVHLASDSELREYTVYDSFINSVGAAVGGQVLREGGTLLKNLPRLLRGKVPGNIKPEVSMNTATAQMAQGLKPNVDPIYKAAKFMKVKGSQMDPNFKMEKLHGQNIRQRTFFRVPKGGVDFNSKLGSYGNYTHIMDNGSLAERIKLDPYIEAANPNIEAFQMKSHSVLDADARLDAAQTKLLQERLNISDKDLTALTSFRDAMEWIKSKEDAGDLAEGSLEIMLDSLRDTGVEGIHYVDNIAGENSNVMMVLNDAVLDNTHQVKAGQGYVDGKQLEAEAIKYAEDPKSKMDYDEVEAKHFKETMDAPEAEFDPETSKMNREAEELLDELEIEENAEFVDKEVLAKVREEFDDLAVDETLFAKIIQTTKACMR